MPGHRLVSLAGEGDGVTGLDHHLEGAGAGAGAGAGTGVGVGTGAGRNECPEFKCR